MADDQGQLDSVNVVDMSFTDGGRSMRFELRNGFPPYESKSLSVNNAIHIRLSQLPGDEYPYFIPDLRWTRLSTSEQANLLRIEQFGFSGGYDLSVIKNDNLIVVEFEGALCGIIVAESVCVN